jgi:hypothetical protein
MSRVVAAVFDDNLAADRAVAALSRAGFARDDVARFMVNPPGRHHSLPLGGDEVADQGAEGGEKGALSGVAVGAAVGAAAGLVATPLLGPAAIAGGLAAGAYAGSLAGAVNSLGEPVQEGVASNVVRGAGVMVAVHVRLAADEAPAVVALREGAPNTIEWNTGTWRGGGWIDFDPVAQPERIEDCRTGEAARSLQPADPSARRSVPE